MVPTSPNAILAVPERLLPERAEAKGVAGAEVPFAGLMAQFVQAPSATPQPEAPQAPPPEAQAPLRRPLPPASQAEVAGPQADQPTPEASAPEGRVARPRQLPERPAPAGPKAPTETATSAPPSPETPPAQAVPVAPGVPLLPLPPVEASAGISGIAAAAAAASGPSLSAAPAPPSQAGGTQPAMPRLDGTAQPDHTPEASAPAPVPPDPKRVPPGRTTLSPIREAAAAAQPPTPHSQAPIEATATAPVEPLSPPATGFPAPQAVPGNPPARSSEPTPAATQISLPEAPALPLLAASAAPVAAAPASTSGNDLQATALAAPSLPPTRPTSDPEPSIVASPGPRVAPPAARHGASAPEGQVHPAPEMPRLPSSAASTFRPQSQAEAPTESARPNGVRPLAEAEPQVPAVLPASTQTRVTALSVPPAATTVQGPGMPEGQVPAMAVAIPASPGLTPPPDAPTVLPVDAPSAKPVLPTDRAALPPKGSAPATLLAGPTGSTEDAVPQAALPAQASPAAPAAALAALASGATRPTPKPTVAGTSDSSAAPVAAPTPSAGGHAGGPPPVLQGPPAPPRVTTTPIPANPDVPTPNLGSLRAPAAEPVPSLKEALARPFPEPPDLGVSMVGTPPASRPTVGSPVLQGGLPPVERAAPRPPSPAPAAATDRAPLAPEVSRAAPGTPERPEAGAGSTEGAVLKPVGNAPGLALQGPDGSAMAASTAMRTQAPGATQGATPAQAPLPPPATPNPLTAQVEGGVRWMLRGGAQEAQLQLHPESLGQVTIHLRVEGGEVHARLWITEPASVQAVQEGRPHLEHSLREQGLQLGSFDLHQGHRPFQEAPSAPVVPERRLPEAVPARQEAPAAPVVSILNPHHVELYA